MKAVVIERFGGPEVMDYREVPTPKPGPGEVLVEVHAVTVNRTLDIHVRQDGDGRNPTFPIVLGADPAGIIAEVGPDVDPGLAGAHVAVVRGALPCGECGACRDGREHQCANQRHLGIHAWGGYADYVVLPRSCVAVVPENLDFPAAAVLYRHFPAAFHLLDRKANLRPGETVLVMGAGGGLGNAGVQVALYRGARVIAAAGNETALQNARDLGAEAAFNYRSEDLEARVNSHTGGAGVNVVFENMGDPVLFPKAFNCLGGGGRLVTAGAHAGGLVLLDVQRLYRRKLSIIGGAGADAIDVEATTEGAAAGRFRAAIDRILPLSEVREAHRIVSEREVVGKVVMVPDRVFKAERRPVY